MIAIPLISLEEMSRPLMSMREAAGLAWRGVLAGLFDLFLRLAGDDCGVGCADAGCDVGTSVTANYAVTNRASTLASGSREASRPRASAADRRAAP